MVVEHIWEGYKTNKMQWIWVWVGSIVVVILHMNSI